MRSLAERNGSVTGALAGWLAGHSPVCITVVLTSYPPHTHHTAPHHVLQVVYETLPGWKQDISKVRTWADLPENARK